jgi:sec-independent protein translocase protein TatA
MDIGWPEILIIALVVLVLFGSKKLPDAARSLGRSMRILKTEVKGMHDEDEAADAGQPAHAQSQPPAALPPATPAAPPATSAQAPAQVGDQPESR